MSNDPKVPAGRVFTQEELSKITEISEDFFTHYSNRIRIAASQLEFRLFVGEVYLTAKNEPKAVENFCIVIPPGVALAVSTLLASTIANYEKQWGPIKKLEEVPLPAQAVKPLNS